MDMSSEGDVKTPQPDVRFSVDAGAEEWMYLRSLTTCNEKASSRMTLCAKRHKSLARNSFRNFPAIGDHSRARFRQ
jgi:hypothetical protein